jgi:iron complex outermembrane receptor protein
MTHRKKLALTIAAALACSGTPLFAQDDANAADENDAATLDAIVVTVTANKRVENVRDVGASISVVDERQLENIGAVSLSDYAALIPGMQVQNNGTPGLTSVSLRGVAAMSSGATVATYIDDVPVGSSGIYQGANSLMLDLLPYDIDHVEVLRGPQGTLYGAGAIGGLLKFVTRAPDLSSMETRLGLGVRTVQDGTQDYNARFASSVPLQEDRLGMRVSFARVGIPGFTDDRIGGRDDINDGDQIGARTALWWNGDDFDLNFGVLHQRTRSDDRSGVALDPDTFEPLFGEDDDLLWQPRPFEKELTLLSLGLDWDLGWGNFVSATGWSKTDTRDKIDATVQFGEVANLLLGLPEAGSSFVDYTFDLDKVTQEFRLTSATGETFEWMLGAFYTKEDADQNQLAVLQQLDGTPLPGDLAAQVGTLAAIGLPSTYEETALFANGAWRFTDRFKIDAGIRQASNEQSFSQNVSAGILAAIGNTPGESDEDVFTWSLSPQFKLNEQVMIYARAASGYQPGGPNVALPGIPPQVDSSMLDSYEIGVKSQSADRRVTLDVAAYRIDWEDIQVGASFNGIGGLVNGGAATSEGVELASLFRLGDSFSIGLNAAYTKSTIKNDFEATVIPQTGFDVILNTGLAGDRVPYTPRTTWSVFGEHAFTTSAGFNGQVGAIVRGVGSQFNDTTERQRVTAPGDPSNVLQETVIEPLELDSYCALDLYAGIGKDNWELRVYANNVTGERAWSSLAPVDSEVTGVRSHLRGVPIQPRTVGIEIDFFF